MRPRPVNRLKWNGRHLCKIKQWIDILWTVYNDSRFGCLPKGFRGCLTYSGMVKMAGRYIDFDIFTLITLIYLKFVISLVIPSFWAYLQVSISILTFPLQLPLSDGGHFENMQIRRSKRIRKGYIRGYLCQLSWFLHKVHTTLTYPIDFLFYFCSLGQATSERHEISQM